MKYILFFFIHSLNYVFFVVSSAIMFTVFWPLEGAISTVRGFEAALILEMHTAGSITNYVYKIR